MCALKIYGEIEVFVFSFYTHTNKMNLKLHAF